MPSAGGLAGSGTAPASLGNDLGEASPEVLAGLSRDVHHVDLLGIEGVPQVRLQLREDRDRPGPTPVPGDRNPWEQLLGQLADALGIGHADVLSHDVLNRFAGRGVQHSGRGFSGAESGR